MSRRITVIILAVLTLGLLGVAIAVGVTLQNQQAPQDTSASADLCPNGVVNTGEQCDDGNRLSGDGCSSTCQLELDLVTTPAECQGTTTETYTVTLKSDANSCIYPTKKNNGNVAGINEVTKVVNAGNVCAVNSLSASSSASKFKYDDAFAIAINNALLVASHSPLYDPFPSDGNLKIWDDFSTIDQLRLKTVAGKNKNDPPRCVGGSDCSIPPSDTKKADFKLELTDAISQEIAQYLSGSENYNVTLYAVGDNDKTDCRVDELQVVIEVETKPLGCSCNFVTPVCGNGSIEAGEQCDDGNSVDNDQCSNSCLTKVPVCGNGVTESPEQCDDGNSVNGDGCSNTCSLTTQCSDGIDNDNDGLVDCTVGASDPGCYPDGAGGGGECNPDDDNEIDQISCGNAKVETGEQCDDGNTLNGDGCSAQCGFEATVSCGNGIVETGEQCDDGNSINGDGCSSVCVAEVPVVVPPVVPPVIVVAELPDTALFDDSTDILLVGMLLIIGGIVANRYGLLLKLAGWSNSGPGNNATNGLIEGFINGKDMDLAMAPEEKKFQTKVMRHRERKYKNKK